jgi:PAS domain S-box-containing protein
MTRTLTNKPIPADMRGCLTSQPKPSDAEGATGTLVDAALLLLTEAPAAIAILRGPDHVHELANPRYCALVGRTTEQLIGRGGREALPELAEHGVWDAFDRIRVSGERFVGHAFPAALAGAARAGDFNWIGQPVRDPDGRIERILFFASEITDHMREQIEASVRAEAAAREEAEAARCRLEALTGLAFALAGAVTLDEVGNIVVEQGMRQARADTCTLYVFDEAKESLELLAHRGVAPEVIDKVRRITRREGNPAGFARVIAGTAVWAETAAEYAAIFPAVANTPATGPRARAFWSMPLVVESRPIGLLGMGFYREQHFSDGERTFVDAFVKQCAQALRRAERRDRELALSRWLSTTLQSIGDAVIATDTAGCVTFMNGIAERLTGWRESEARGRPLEEVFVIFSELTREPVKSPVAKILREGTVVGLSNHTVLRSRSGSEIPIDDSGAPIRDGPEIFGVVLVFRDVTAEKRNDKRRAFLARAAETLASSLDYRTTLAHVAQLAVPQLADWCTVDILEPHATVPQQLAVAHADPAKVAHARKLGERYPPDPKASTGAPQVIRTGKSELYAEIPEALLEAVARDEEHLRLLRDLRLESAMVVALPGRAGRALGAMTFIYAASGRRYTREDLDFAESFAKHAAMAIENARALKEVEAANDRERLLRREAEQANAVKDEFLATVSHELRTPLNAILGWAVTLQRRDTSPEVRRALGVIERNALTQRRLIEDLLDVSRIISGKLTLALRPVDVADAVLAAVEGARPAAEAKGIALTAKSMDDGPSLTILADADRLQQILWNLLANAVKFTPKGGAVSVEVRRLGSEVVAKVTDTGEGIAAAALPGIFELFRQADNSTTRRHGGLGLGLSLVKELAAAHGGTVEATSAGEGRGATFVVRLPARALTPAVHVESRTATRRLDIEPGMESDLVPEVSTDVLPRLDGLAVLVVDDEEDAREIVGNVFVELGARVYTADSAASALDWFRAIRPDVVVSDIGMPHADGYSLIRSIRSLAAHEGGRTPAVALTAYSGTQDAERAFAAGYQRHVTKPVDPHKLVALVANLAGRGLMPVT